MRLPAADRKILKDVLDEITSSEKKAGEYRCGAERQGDTSNRTPEVVVDSTTLAMMYSETAERTYRSLLIVCRDFQDKGYSIPWRIRRELPKSMGGRR
jgi:hypothetical protein